MSSHLTDVNSLNKSLTVELLQKGYRYHKLRIAFFNFYHRHFDFFSKNNSGLRSLLQQGLSEPDFYGDLVYKFRKMYGKQNFRININNIMRYKLIGCNIDVIRQSACLMVNPVTVNNFVVLFSCMPLGRGSDSMIAQPQS